MTSFSLGVESVSLVVLGSLLTYTIALIRTKRLSAHIAVRWVLAEVGAIGAVLLWGRLPVIAYTSVLGDRELLVVLAVLFFGLIAFLMLDSLQRISAQSAQLRRLAQELALLQARAGSPPVTVASEDAVASANTHSVEAAWTRPGPFATLIVATWIIVCVMLYVVEAEGRLPEGIVRLLTAAFRQ